MEDWRPKEMPTLAVSRIARILLKLADDKLRPIGITTAQLPVLVALKGGDRLTQKELTKIAGVEQPSMAQLLSRMEREGLVRREPAPDDRRSSLFVLTDWALEQLDPGREALRRMDADACIGFSDQEKAALLALLARLEANVESSRP